MKKILVTGGAGFIGSHTCIKLVEAGYKIITLDSYVNSSKVVFEKLSEICNYYKLNNNLIEVVEGDIRDEKQLETIFRNENDKKNSIQAVVHFAGLKAVKDSCLNPIEYWDVNVRGSLNLLSVMQRFNCKKLVFSSSATIYGNSEELPMTELCPIKPMNPYGNTKATIENFLADIHKSSPNEWNIINLRYFNPVGAHQSGFIGENGKGTPNNLFPYICKVAAGEIEELKIFGNDWPTKDGTGVRDYIHIDDLADGHKKALDLIFNENGNYRSINLGKGYGISVLEMVEMFEKVNRCKVKKTFAPRRKGDIGISYANIEKAKRVLGWHPKKSLADICKDGWRWKKLNLNSF